MRPALVTILPMLAAAILVMVGGERLARREVETRTPADRGRLLDLADSFRDELDRLDALYIRHLDEIAGNVISNKPEEAEAAANQIRGIRSTRVFQTRGKDLTFTGPPERDRLPEIEIGGGKRPLDESTAVVLDPLLLDQPIPNGGVWLPTKNPSFRVHYRQPVAGTLVVFLVDVTEIREATTTHLRTWLATPLTPLREAGERVEIESSTGATLVSIGPERHGPAASIIPTRTLTGDWQIRSWDGLTINYSHDSETLAAAGTLSLILAASGFLIYFQHNRAIKLASERVSFVNRVSHELGTPLTNLSLNLDLATEALTTRPADAQRRLGIVAEEVGRLSRLVANVLTFSRRERDSLELKPTRCIPGDIVLRTLESFRPALERRGIAIEMAIAAETPARMDPDALSQVTGNLISNVEKYAASGHWMRIECREESGFLTLEVSDRGPGIPAKFRQRVFIPFERVLDTTNEGASGTGLGLSIGRDLAMRMGGTLELLDAPEGAAFRLRIPAPPALTIVPSDTDAA